MKVKFEYRGNLHAIGAVGSLQEIRKQVDVRYPLGQVILGFVRNNAVHEITSFDQIVEEWNKNPDVSVKVRVFDDFAKTQTQPKITQKVDSAMDGISKGVEDLKAPQECSVEKSQNYCEEDLGEECQKSKTLSQKPSSSVHLPESKEQQQDYYVQTVHKLVKYCGYKGNVKKLKKTLKEMGVTPDTPMEVLDDIIATLE